MNHKLMVRMMAAIRAIEKKGMDMALISETAPKAPEEERDRMALKLREVIAWHS